MERSETPSPAPDGLACSLVQGSSPARGERPKPGRDRIASPPRARCALLALLLRELLEQRGARVVMSRTEDVAVPLADRALLARNERADVFVSIHHNATADPTVNLPIVYFHGSASENRGSVELGRILLRHVRGALFTDATPASLVSDLAIYPGSGTGVLRNTYGIPAVICEASFFSNPEEERRLRTQAANCSEPSAGSHRADHRFHRDDEAELLETGRQTA